ncbi:uncharacterized protein AB675_875 [Cyphellophora attinorum]|uniref:Life-span regulatory factor domain-containing protein n=1 Tax=Cyphellophora attinorum TaxID=1664694 RepID=A0A0N1HBK8_9EURO|nr:uncharacterized protein AB675_875 [Phialophora attinorum]KPI45593.1 hypothetical protein AB675_875 [Phialophora attinorum]
MATSFLQYCAMCEKQITTPSNSILYCSQACRRKDATKPISASILPPSPTTPSTRSGANSRSVSPQRASTPSMPSSPAPTIRIPADQHGYKADLDPTEWKPKLRRPDGLLRGAHMRKSEAYRYLASFHSRAMLGHEGGDGLSGNGEGKVGVHRYSSSMYAVPTMGTPSLSNTPTTTSSSFDGSWDKANGSGGVGGHAASVGADGEYPYDFSTRPLQSRCNPLYAIGSGAKVEDLVTPFVPPKVFVGPVEDDTVVGTAEDFWGKQMVTAGSGGKEHGLSKLLSKRGL